MNAFAISRLGHDKRKIAKHIAIKQICDQEMGSHLINKLKPAQNSLI